MTSATAVKKNLLHFLKKPSRIASVLDWKKASSSILTLDIRRDQISLVVALHPSFGEAPQHLTPIPLHHENSSTPKKNKVLSHDVIDELKTIVREHNVCGVLVSWPLEKEGRQGAPCGRVLHTLDSLIEQSSSILSHHRPFCLWDADHIPLEFDDEWGRCPTFGEHKYKEAATVLIDGEKQYEQDHRESMAANLWNDFCKAHWPELAEQALAEQAHVVAASGYRHSDEASEWQSEPEECSAHLKKALI